MSWLLSRVETTTLGNISGQNSSAAKTDMPPPASPQTRPPSRQPTRQGTMTLTKQFQQPEDTIGLIVTEELDKAIERCKSKVKRISEDCRLRISQVFPLFNIPF
jgi:hypothetical protein